MTDFLFKTIVVGEPGADSLRRLRIFCKTSLIQRYVHDKFNPNYIYTIGVDFALKVIELKKNTTVRLQLWDVAGQERFGKMTRVYYKEAAGCIIVFDITDRRTFTAVTKWKKDLDEKVQLSTGEPVPCILLANKSDLKPRPVPKEEIDALVKELGCVAWFEVSAKASIGIEDAINVLVNTMLKDPSSIPAGGGGEGGFKLTQNATRDEPQEQYCCGK